MTFMISRGVISILSNHYFHNLYETNLYSCFRAKDGIYAAVLQVDGRVCVQLCRRIFIEVSTSLIFTFIFYL